MAKNCVCEVNIVIYHRPYLLVTVTEKYYRFIRACVYYRLWTYSFHHICFHQKRLEQVWQQMRMFYQNYYLSSLYQYSAQDSQD